MKRKSGITAVIALALIILPSVALMQPSSTPEAHAAAAFIAEYQKARTPSEKKRALVKYNALSKEQKRYIPSAVPERLAM